MMQNETMKAETIYSNKIGNFYLVIFISQKYDLFRPPVRIYDRKQNYCEIDQHMLL